MTDHDEIAQLRAEITALRERLVLLEDRQAIFDCLHRYSRGLDRLDPKILRSAYFEDARDRHGAVQGTSANFVEWVTKYMLDWDSSLHILDLNNVDIHGDTADSECYVLFSQRRADGSRLDFGGARYLDHLEKRDGQWRIAVRNLVIDWTAGADVTVFPDAADHPASMRGEGDLSYSRPFVTL
jgi:hypothetical protein